MVDEVNSITPFRLATMCLATSRVHSIAPVKLTAKIRFQHSSVILVTGSHSMIPALLTKISMPPSSRSPPAPTARPAPRSRRRLRSHEGVSPQALHGFLGRPFPCLDLDIAVGDIHPFPGQGEADVPSNASLPSGHQRVLVCQSKVHIFSLQAMTGPESGSRLDNTHRGSHTRGSSGYFPAGPGCDSPIARSTAFARCRGSGSRWGPGGSIEGFLPERFNPSPGSPIFQRFIPRSRRPVPQNPCQNDRSFHKGDRGR